MRVYQAKDVYWTLSSRNQRQHPASLLRELRALVLATYEKHGIDVALEVLKRTSSERTVKAGLRGELIFYDKYRDKFRLEPLLDAGSKADFVGRKPRDPRMTNFDVTTNIDYKDIDRYVDCVRTRGKRYVITLVNLRSEEMTFFPLRFPVCQDCNRFSHYLLYLVPSSTQTFQGADISDEQTIIRYCPWCSDSTEIRSYAYPVHSISAVEEEMSWEKDVDECDRYSAHEIKEAVETKATSEVRFFRRLSRLELSGIAENHYQFTGHRGEGYWEGKLHWKHPLAKALGDAIDFHYEPWGESK